MWRTTSGKLVYYQFGRLLPHTDVVHGVFTRLGGHSHGPWRALNTGHTVGDDPAAVRANHEAICRALGLAVGDLVSPYQVHGARVAVVGAAHRGSVIAETDALLTNEPGVPLMLRFADCVPIWLYDPVCRAIGLAHAGWRGTVQGMAQRTVDKMIEAYGTRPCDVIAGIGPAIGPCCYEVGEDVVNAVGEAFGQAAEGFLVRQSNGRWRLDLWTANEYLLRRAGVTKIEVAKMCTACHTDEWFSHRAEKGRTGRMGALVALRQ